MNIRDTHYCKLWKALLTDPNNRGQIYEDFKNQHMDLAQHFRRCKTCIDLIKAVLPTDVFTPAFHQMTTDEFTRKIRWLWNLARLSP